MSDTMDGLISNVAYVKHKMVDIRIKYMEADNELKYYQEECFRKFGHDFEPIFGICKICGMEQPK